MSATGASLDTITYDSFGNATDSNSAYTNGDRFKYTGREWDAAIGQYDYRARYYDPSVGRFDSEDPTGFAGGDSNLYRYVDNSPTNYLDPTGLDRTVGHLGHVWIRVVTYDENGKKNGCVYLHFSPAGYTVDPTSYYPEYPGLWPGGTIPSTPAQDKQLVELWRELEKQRVQEGWSRPGLNYTGFNNCWVPVLLLHHYPDVKPRVPPPATIRDDPYFRYFQREQMRRQREANKRP